MDTVGDPSYTPHFSRIQKFFLDLSLARDCYFPTVQPADILQGGLGDCWLMAGMASVAMYPHLIRQIFQQREYNPVGKYKLR